MTRSSRFAADDHRNFNRDGSAFDRGETFSGVPFEVGLEAVEELRPLVPAGASLASLALRWILMNEAVTCVIPGGKRPAQVDENCSAADLPALPAATMAKIREILRPADSGLRPPLLVSRAPDGAKQGRQRRRGPEGQLDGAGGLVDQHAEAVGVATVLPVSASAAASGVGAP